MTATEPAVHAEHALVAAKPWRPPIENSRHADPALHAEHTLIGALLYDRDTIAIVVGTLSPEAFSHPQYRAIYEAICNLWDRREPPDVVTVGHELHRMGKVAGDIPPWDVLTGIMATMDGWIVHAEYYRDLVVEYAKQRAMAKVGTDVILRANRGDTKAETALIEAQRAMERFGAVTDTTPPTYADLIADARYETVERWEGRLVERVTPTGLHDLDHTLRGGWRAGELAVLGGRPGMGKTQLMLHMAHAAATKASDETAVIFSLEMSTRSLLERAITGDAALPYGVGLDPRYPTVAREAWLAASGRLEGLNVRIDDTSGLTTGSMQLRVARIQHERPVSVVIIDHLDHIGDDIRTQTQTHKLSAILKRLRTLAKVCQVPVVLICHLNRAVEQRESKVPQLSDFKDSGSIEQDADVAMLLFRRRYYSERGMLLADPDKDYYPASNLQRVSLIVAKNRNGAPDSIHLGWDAQTMQFKEVSR